MWFWIKIHKNVQILGPGDLLLIIYSKNNLKEGKGISSELPASNFSVANKQANKINNQTAQENKSKYF